MSFSRHQGLGIASLHLLAALGGTQAAAQQTGPEGSIEEVVVTAQRRAQTLVEVPMSITALSGEALEARGMTDFLDYAVSVPSLSFGFSGAEARGSRNTISIRGVSVGYYVDDTPIPYGVDPHLFDLERVEILRGPQGTLYGAGSMGGTVRLISREPDPNEYSARLRTSVSYTKEGGPNAELAGATNIPLVEERLGARVSAFYESRSGFYDRVFGEPLPWYPDAPEPALRGVHEDIDDADTWGGRVALAFTPTDDFEIVPSVYWQKTEEQGAPQADIDPGAFEQFRAYDIEEPYEDRHLLANLTIRYDFGYADFVSSTSSFDRKWEEAEDITEVIDLFFRGAYADPSAPPYPAVIFNNRDQDRFVQELRLSGEAGVIDWLVGGFYQNVETARNASFLMEGLADDPRYVDFGVDDVMFVSEDVFETTEKAAFADVSWQLTDDLDVSAGIRAFDNETETARDSGGLLDAGVMFSGRKSDETGTTPRLAARYRLGERTSVYAAASKGFRLGGSNLSLPPTCDAELAELGVATPDTFDSDSLWNYEIGTKARLFDGALSIDAAVFQIDWDDIQQNVRLPSCGFSFTSNVGESEIRGFEIEAVYSPTDALDIELAISQNRSKVKDPGQGTAAEAGDELLNTPEWKFSTSGAWHFVLAGREAWLEADYEFFDDSWSTFNQDDPENLADPQPFLPRDDFQIVDARLGISFGATDLIFFVENVFDEHANLGDARSIGVEFPGRPRLITNRPRTIGAQALISFR